MLQLERDLMLELIFHTGHSYRHNSLIHDQNTIRNNNFDHYKTVLICILQRNFYRMSSAFRPISNLGGGFLIQR
jgi:hypothetical protein